MLRAVVLPAKNALELSVSFTFIYFLAKDSVRVSYKTQSPYFDGLMDNWYHFSCIWETRHYPTSTDEVY